MSLWWSLCTLYLHMCQVRVTVGDSGLCCICVTSFKTLMNSFVVLILQERSGPHILFQIYKQQLEKLGKKHPMPSSSVYLSHWLCTRLQCTEFLACWWKVSSRCWLCWMGLVFEIAQNSGAVWKLRWPSWAPVPNKPMVSVDVKQHFNLKLQPLWMLSKIIAFIPEIAD